MSEELRARLRAIPSFPAELPRFDPEDVPDAPEPLFLAWLDDALAHGVLAAHAAALATTDDGGPSARILILRDLDERGWLIGTPADSRPGRAMTADPRAALTFFWPSRGRQVRVEGAVEQAPDAESRADAAARATALGIAPDRSWSLWRIAPTAVEFWQASHDRAHLRLRYLRDTPAAPTWTRTRL